MNLSSITNSRASRPGESVNHDLWRGCISLWAPCLGNMGYGNMGRRGGLVDLGPAGQGLNRQGGTNGPSPFGNSLVLAGGGGGGYLGAVKDSYNNIWTNAVFTSVCLFKPTTTTFGVIFDNCGATSTNQGYSFYQNGSGNMVSVANYANTGFTVFTQTGSGVTVTNRWNLCVCSCDGAVHRMWLNGRSQGTAAVSAFGSGNSSYTPSLGSYGNGINSNVFNGSIAYFGIWKRPWHQGEAMQLSRDPMALFSKRRYSIGKAGDIIIPPVSNNYIIIQRRRRIM